MSGGPLGTDPALPLTAPATDAAKQWEGYGTALKPAVEYIICAQKPSPDTERRIIVENLWRLEAQLWSLLPVSVAVESFGSSPREYAEACVSAQWSADDESNSRAALSGLMATSRFVPVMTSCLSTVRSWRLILAEDSGEMNTSTTETVSSPTTDWKTLRSCLLALTPSAIIEAASRQLGSWWLACPAARHFNAELSSIAATRTPFAPDSVTSKAGDLDLRPEWRPIIMARLPLDGTVAANVQKWGTGALNIDGARVAKTDSTIRPNGPIGYHGGGAGGVGGSDVGRWPANLIHDGSDEVAARFPRTATGSGHVRHAGHVSNGGSGYKSKAGTDAYWQGDSGSAARFFYEAKASADEREQNLLGSIPCVHCGGLDTVTHKDDEGRNVPCRRNVHPTVKPIALAQYLARLILPAPVAAPRRILVPFSGSGSEMLGALYAGWEMVLGIEISPEYADIARARLARDIQAPLL